MNNTNRILHAFIFGLTAVLMQPALPQERMKPQIPEGCRPTVGGAVKGLLSVQPIVPFASLVPTVTEQGEQLFTFTMQWDEGQLKKLCLLDDSSREIYVKGQIGGRLAAAQWCLNGWAIMSRKIIETNPGTLVIEGHCK